MTLLLVTAAVAGIVGALLLETVIRRTPVGAALLLGGTLLPVTLNTELLVPIGPFNVFLGDLLFLLLAAAGVARLLRATSIDRNQVLLIGLILAVAYSAGRGVGTIAVDEALNEARQPLRFYTTALYFSMLAPTRALISVLSRLWFIAAAVLGVLALLRWGALAGGAARGWLASPGDPLRVLNSDEALLVLQALIIGIGATAAGTRARRVHVALGAMLLLVLGLQHRTVWVAAIACLVVASVRNGELGRRVAVGVSLLAVSLMLLLLTVLADDATAPGGEVTGRITNQDTFEWRLEGWSQLLSEGPAGVHEVLLGEPFGSGWERRVFGITVDVAPHNWYLETYLRTGVLGLALLLVLGARLAAACLRRAGPYSPEHEVVLALLLSQAIYFLTYTPSAVQGIVTGTAIALLRHGGVMATLTDWGLPRSARV